MHIVGLSLASLCGLVPLDKRIGRSIKFLEFEVARGRVITKSTRYSKIFTTSIKDHISWLTLWSTNIDRSHVNSIILTFKRNLKRLLILLIFTGISWFRHELLDSRSNCGLFFNLGICSLDWRWSMCCLSQWGWWLLLWRAIHFCYGRSDHRILMISKLSICTIFNCDYTVVCFP